MLVLSMPRTGSSEFCRQLVKSLTRETGKKVYFVSEFLNPTAVNFFGKVAFANRHFLDSNLEPYTTDVLTFKRNLSVDSISLLEKIETRNQVFEQRTVEFRSADELLKFIKDENEVRLNFLKLCHDAGLTVVIKHFGFDLDIVNSYKQQVSENITFYYRKNLNDLFFSQMFKQVYLDDKFAATHKSLNSDATAKFGRMGHNFGDQTPLEPVTGTELTSRASLRMSLKVFKYVLRNNLHLPFSINYEDFFAGKECKFIFDGQVYSMTIDAVTEHKMNYASTDKEQYFTNYKEMIETEKALLKELPDSFTQHLGLHF